VPDTTIIENSKTWYIYDNVEESVKFRQICSISEDIKRASSGSWPTDKLGC